jgi:hypothetical protein
MDEGLEKIILRLRLSNLEAQLELRGIERAGLSREIESLQTSPGRRAEALARRDVVLAEWLDILAKLEDLRGKAAN